MAVADLDRVVLMSGLPAAGKTTTAQRIHDAVGGALIRQCDVYARLGIDLREWARRTEGFTRDVEAYERVRDQAYAVMLDDVRVELSRGTPAIVVDAVHGEPAKRRAIYEACAAHASRALVVWCRCEDGEELRRRFAARVDRTEPEHEASDLSVHRHIRSLWQPPVGDRLPDGTPVPVIVHDTVANRWDGLDAVPALARALAR